MSYNYPSSAVSSISATPSSSTIGGTLPPNIPTSISHVLIAHAVCGGIATLLLLPLGVLIPRYGRALSKGRWWFPLHMGAQLIGVVFAIVAISTGYHMGAAPGTAHPGLAITLITGLGLQILLGSLAHWYKPKSNGPAAPSGRGVFHFVHIGLGLAVVIIGWATALTGFIQQWVGGFGAGFGEFVTGWKVVFGVLIGLFGIAYIFAIVFHLSRVRRRDIGDIPSTESTEKHLYPGGHPSEERREG